MKTFTQTLLMLIAFIGNSQYTDGLFYNAGSLGVGTAKSLSWEYSEPARNGEYKRYSENRLCPNQDGKIYFEWENDNPNFLVGFTNENSSVQNNGAITHYVKWVPHPYGDQIQCDLGNGLQTLKTIERQYEMVDNVNLIKKKRYRATIERVGNQVIVNVEADGDGSGTDSITVDPSQSLMLDATFYSTANSLNDLKVNFLEPFVLDQTIDAENDVISISATKGQGSYTYNWTTPNGSSSASSVSTPVAGEYTVTVSDGRDACNITRTFHHVGDAKPIELVHDRDLAGSGICEISSEFDASIYQLTQNNKSATFESKNRMSAGENGVLTFSFDPRETHNSRIGFTNYEASAAFNANVHYYIEWNTHPYGESVRINLGDGFETISIPHFSDGHIEKNIHVECKLERDGDFIKATVDIDGQVNQRIYRQREIAGLSEKQLTLDGWMYRHTSNDAYWSKFNDINVNFATPIEFETYTIAESYQANIEVSGGSESYKIEWTSEEGTSGQISGAAGINLVDFQEPGVYTVTVTDVTPGYDQTVYTNSRVIHILENVQKISLTHERDLAGSGTCQIDPELNGTISQITANNKSATFESLNRMSPFEDGALTFTFDSRDSYNSRIGFTSYESSASVNANVHYYVEWNEHPYGETIRVNLGNGVENIPVPRYGDGSLPKDIHVAGKIEREGDSIRVTLDVDGQTNFHWQKAAYHENVSWKELTINGYSYKHTTNPIYDAKFKNVNCNFSRPIEMTHTVDMATKKVNLAITGATGSFNIEWTKFGTETVVASGTASYDPETASFVEYSQVLPEGGTYVATVTDATTGADVEVYKKSRVFHILNHPNNIVINNERALNGGGAISSPMNGTLTSALFNGKGASFETENALNVDEDGALLFTFDSRNNYNSRIGLTSDLASSTYNANVHYYVEWYQHVSGCEVRVNVGNGVEKVLIPRWDDGNHLRNVTVTGKLERIDDEIIATIDLDGNPVEGLLNTHKVFRKTIEGLSKRILVVDAMTFQATREDQRSKFKNVNVSFGKPIEFDYTLDQENGSVELAIEGGSGQYIVEWYKGEDLIEGETFTTISGLKKGQYRAVVKDARYAADQVTDYDNSEVFVEKTFFLLGDKDELTFNKVLGGDVIFDAVTGAIEVSSNATSFVSEQVIPANEDVALTFSWDIRATHSMGIGFSESEGYYAGNGQIEYYAEIYNANSGMDVRLYDREGAVEKIFIPRYTDGHVHKKGTVTGLIERVGNQIILKVVVEGQHKEVFSISSPADDAIANKELVIDGWIGQTTTKGLDIAYLIGSEVELVTSKIDEANNTGCEGDENGVIEYSIDQANGTVSWAIKKDGEAFATGTRLEGETIRYDDLEPGSYTIAFADEADKTDGDEFTIEDDSKKVSAEVERTTEITCFVDGVVYLKGLEGVGPYRFDWAKVSGDDTLSSGSGDSVLYKYAGAHNLNVTVTDLGDEDACPSVIPLSFAINEGERTKIEGLEIVVDPISCTNNKHTFSLENLPSDGEFSLWWRVWDAESNALITRSQRSAEYTRNVDGNYRFEVHVRDASGKYCRMDHPQIINAKANEVSVDPEFVMDGCDKVKIKFNPSVDVTKVTVKGYNASSRRNINQTTTSSELTIDAGLYRDLRIIAKNDEGCENPRTYSNKDLGGSSDDISVSFSSIDPQYCDQYGRVELNVNGVTSEDRVTWSYAKYRRPTNEVLVNAPGQSKYQRSTLPADFTHYVTITDAEGCVYNFSDTQEMRAKERMDWDISVFRDPTCDKKGLLQTENFTGVARSRGSYTRYFYVGDEAIYDRKKEGKYKKMEFDPGTYSVKVDMFLWLGGHDYCHESKTETVTFEDDCESNGSNKTNHNFTEEESDDQWLMEETQEEEAVTNEFTAYPNPTTDVIKFQFDKLVEGSTLKLYSMDGKLLVNQTITASFLEFDLSAYSKGIYLYQVISPKGQLKSGRVVKN